MTPIKTLEVHLTHRCTLRCDYCYAGLAQAAGLPDLTAELADLAVDFLFDHCADERELAIDFWGGEPLLRLDLIERIATRARAHAKKDARNVRFGLPTNGMLYDASARHLLEQLGVAVSLSLDGGKDAFAHRLAPDGSNSFGLIAERLDELEQATVGPLPSVRMTVSPTRASHFHEDLRTLLDRGYRTVAFMPASGVAWNDDATHAFDEQAVIIAHELAGWIERGYGDLPLYLSLARPLSACRLERSAKRPVSATCGAGSTLVAIDTLGDIYPCHRFTAQVSPAIALRLGNVRTGFSDEELRRRFGRLRADEEGIRCATCDRNSVCAARLCAAINFAGCGDPFAVTDETCWVNERLRLAAVALYGAASALPGYDAYLSRLLEHSADERLTPFLTHLRDDAEAIVERASELVRSSGDRHQREKKGDRD